MSQHIPDFTADQLEFLERTFPEKTNHIDNKGIVPQEELYVRLGQRQVVNRIRQIHEDKRRNLK
jgi:hypothetical protein